MQRYPGHERKLDTYMTQIGSHRLLSREEEQQLAVHFVRTGDQAAAHRLVLANLRFVVKVAHSYRGYGLTLRDLVQEGNLGLMTAVRKFDPHKGYRLVSYAIWWIRAYIQSFIMRSWSLVKVGTTQAQRRLFFRVRSERERADRLLGNGRRAALADIAATLQVGADDVAAMEMRLRERDCSLNAAVGPQSAASYLDLLPSNSDSQEQQVASLQLRDRLRRQLATALPQMTSKEQYVITHRLLCDEPPTLQQIGCVLRISRERVRQIECAVIRKLRQALTQGDAAA